ILLEAFEGSLRVSSTDLRVSLNQQTTCAIEQAGSVAVPGRKLHEIVREMPGGQVRLELKENGWLTVSSGKSVFHIPGVAAEEYPGLPAAPESFLGVDAALFRTMLDKTLFAAASDESRIYLCGVYVKTVKDEEGNRQLRMVATDGHRLSLSEQAVKGDLDPFAEGVILPKKGLSELRSLIDSCETTFELAAADGRVYVRVGRTLLSITLIDASFPNYQQVIPPEVEIKLYIEREALVDALRRVSLLSDQETHTVIMESSGDGTVLSSTNSQFGDAREELDSEFAGKPLRVAFNAVYLLEAIRSLSGHTVAFSIGDALAPCLLRGSDDPDHLCVVMPMRID
ncbi:MAG TPA: DNA polymerase III subunit beta, partial [Deferrisomatales bacterium]|nr:DNA polymerase III subunit beta [Deferrisomatales bacterium]